MEAIYFTGDSPTFDVKWPVHSLIGTDNRGQESFTENALTLMDTSLYTKPRFFLGEFTNIQSMEVVSRQNKMLSYAFWEAPPGF